MWGTLQGNAQFQRKRFLCANDSSDVTCTFKVMAALKLAVGSPPTHTSSEMIIYAVQQGLRYVPGVLQMAGVAKRRTNVEIGSGEEISLGGDEGVGEAAAVAAPDVQKRAVPISRQPFQVSFGACVLPLLTLLVCPEQDVYIQAKELVTWTLQRGFP